MKQRHLPLQGQEIFQRDEPLALTADQSSVTASRALTAHSLG
jgi:hypothetical protein